MSQPEEDRYRALVVDPRAAGMRADVYLAARFGEWSRTAVARAIRSGEVRSATRELKPSSTLLPGEELQVFVPTIAPAGPKPPCPPLLHEDPRVLAFDKPAGLLAHPVGRAFAWGLINLARERFPEEPLHLAHRLDRETSGVSLVARDEDANRQLKEAFRARETAKRYLALVRGRVPWDQQRVDAPIGDDMASPIRLKQGVRPDGLPAVTEVTVVERFEALTLVSCRPLTGRTHQLRVHLDALGFPILGDKIYGQPPEVFLSIYEGRPLEDLDARLVHLRHALHAAALTIPHPDGGVLSVEAPLPADFVEVMDRARGEAR
ncbi:MAG: RluA family pseudouridine synthase [Alphaproteobacteria bacterium]|nr:RluA family pseudouridine synthase [Alphaproteobacteria bacterium]